MTVAAACQTSAAPPASASPQRVLAGETPNGETPNGETPNGETPNGETLDGETLDQAQAAALVQGLGAATFARREAAAAEIFSAGPQLLPALRDAAEHDPDPEVRLRAGLLHQQIASTDFEARAASFIADGSDGHTFPGWSYTAERMGDSEAVRQIFIKISRNHPGFVAALDGTPRQRAQQVQQVIESIQRSAAQLREPDVSDTVALLLVAADRSVPPPAALESALVHLLHGSSTQRIRQDAQLAEPFNELIGRWMRRAGMEHRADVLALAMQLDVDDSLALALQTLVETNDPARLETALQVITRFGGPQHAPKVRHLLGDTRPAGDGVPVDTAAGQLQVQIGDVAMATIARLYDVPLESIGFPAATLHSRVGFAIDSLGFPASDSAAREKARAAVEALLDGPASRP